MKPVRAISSTVTPRRKPLVHLLGFGLPGVSLTKVHHIDWPLQELMNEVQFADS
jgi:hypothetical protein